MLNEDMSIIACRRKSGALLLVLLLVSCPHLLAGTGRPENYNVRYESHHYLYQKDGETTVIDYHVEWPEWLYFSHEDFLQNYLAKKLFQVEAGDFTAAEGKFLARFGSRVTGVFDTLPDDAKFCYVEARANILSYVQGRFIVYSLSASVKPQSKSSQKEYALSQIVTFDLSNHSILYSDDIINTEKLKWGGGYRYNRFVESLMAHMSPRLPEHYSYENSVISLQCYPDVGNNLTFVVDVSNEDSSTPFVTRSTVPYRDVKPYVEAKSRELFVDKVLQSKDFPMHEPVDDATATDSLKGVLPPYPGGKKALAEYLANQMNPDVLKAVMEKDVPTTLLMSITFSPDGTVDHMRFLAPASPVLCREVYRVFSLMPSQKRIDGNVPDEAMSQTYTFRIRLNPQSSESQE